LICSAKNGKGSGFDSIWVVTYPQGKATRETHMQDIHPEADCSF
jgi:hypothetical protein